MRLRRAHVWCAFFRAFFSIPIARQNRGSKDRRILNARRGIGRL